MLQIICTKTVPKTQLRGLLFKIKLTLVYYCNKLAYSIHEISYWMKAIHYLPVGLLLLLCILNLYLGIITKPDPSFVMYIVFGVVYFTLGVLLISKMRGSEILGFIIPLAIVFIYPLIVDFKNLHPWSSGFLGATNALVVLFYLYLLLAKIKN